MSSSRERTPSPAPSVQQYREALRQASSGGLTLETVERLQSLAAMLGVEPVQATAIEREVLGQPKEAMRWRRLRDRYRDAVRELAGSGTPHEKVEAQLGALRQELGLGEDQVVDIEREVLGDAFAEPQKRPVASPAGLSAKQLVAIAGSALLFSGVFLPAFGPENYWLDGYGSGKFLLLAAVFSLALVLYRPFHRFLWITGGSALVIIVWDIIVQPKVFSQADPRWELAVVIVGAAAILASTFVPIRGADGRWSFDL